MESDVRYFTRRASEERAAAFQARLSEARQVHAEMAERYEDLVREMTKQEQHLGQESMLNA